MRSCICAHWDKACSSRNSLILLFSVWPWFVFSTPLPWRPVFPSHLKITVIKNEIKNTTTTKYRDGHDLSLLILLWNISYFTPSSSSIPPWSSAQVFPLKCIPASTDEQCYAHSPFLLASIGIVEPLWITCESLIMPCLRVSHAWIPVDGGSRQSPRWPRQ